MDPNAFRNLKSLPARKEPEQCGDGEFLCKAKKALQVLLLPASFFLVGTGLLAGKTIVKAADDFAEEARKEIEEAVKKLVLLALLGFGFYFAWKKI